MATTVGQHSVAAFTSPVNGTTPIDANTVRGNDNTVRVAYVDHDADPGIHVQSSTLASRPAAGTAGRKWINSDYPQKLWYDDGTDWHEVGGDAITVYCKATETIAKGDIVKVTGYNTGQDVPEIAKVSSASDVAFGIAETAIANGSLGYVINTGIIQGVATNSFSLGNILYPNTSGGLTATKPTSGTYQAVAYVLRAHASSGVLYVEFSAPRIVEASANTASTIVLRDASGNFAAGTITAALTGNASTATTLQTARTLWGQSFNGSANVTGALTSVSDITMTGTLSGASTVSATTLTGTLSTAAQPNVTSVGTLSSLTVSGDLTVDTSTLKVDSANNRVGIGVASPATLLDVRGSSVGGNVSAIQIDNTAAGSGSPANTVSLNFANVGSPKASITAGVYGDGYMDFATNNNTVKMRLDASGNLGLGVTPSANSLAKAFELESGFTMFGFANTSYLSANAYYSGGWKYKATAAAAYYEMSGANGHIWKTAASGTAGNTITFTQAMTLDASGNLGVGTASPSSTFGFSQVLELAGTTAALVLNPSNTTSGSGIEVKGASPLRFTINNTERARITSGGNFQVGTAAIATTATDGFLYIPTCAGAPTGTPTAVTGLSPLVVDSTNNRFYVNIGGTWKYATLT